MTDKGHSGRLKPCHRLDSEKSITVSIKIKSNSSSGILVTRFEGRRACLPAYLHGFYY